MKNRAVSDELSALSDQPYDGDEVYELLKMIKPKDHAELSQRAIEIKRMLTGLLQKLKADR